MGSGRVERAKGRAAGAAAARKAGKAKEYSSHASGRHHFPLAIKQPGCYAELCGASSGSRVRWWCRVTHQPAGARPHGIVRALCRDEARAEATGRRPEGDLANTSRFNIPEYLQYPKIRENQEKTSLSGRNCLFKLERARRA
jgi:hypothetical protein